MEALPQGASPDRGASFQGSIFETSRIVAISY